MRKAAADDALSALTAFINDESIEESADHEAELLQILVPSKTVFRKALRTWVSNARHPVVSPVDEVCSILGRLGDNTAWSTHRARVMSQFPQNMSGGAFTCTFEVAAQMASVLCHAPDGQAKMQQQQQQQQTSKALHP